MYFKQSELLAVALEQFLVYFSSSEQRDSAVLQRESLKVKALSSKVTGIRLNSSNISLSGADVLGLFTPEGALPIDSTIARQLDFSYDSGRIDVGGLLKGEPFSTRLKLLIDSVSFAACSAALLHPPFDKLPPNICHLQTHAHQLHVTLDLIMRRLRTNIVSLVLGTLAFAGDDLTAECVAKINKKIDRLKDSAIDDAGIEVDAALLPAPPLPRYKPSYSDAQLVAYQNVWLKALRESVACRNIYQQAECQAKFDLLSIKQAILQVTLSPDGWQVGFQLWPHWEKTGEDSNDFVWLPTRVNALMRTIDAVMNEETTCPTYYQQALTKVKAIIADYQPSSFSSTPSVNFFNALQSKLHEKNTKDRGDSPSIAETGFLN